MKCRQKIQKLKSKSSKDKKWKNNAFMKMWSDSKKCDSKKSKSIKEQEASRLLSSLGIKTPLNNIFLVGPLLFNKY